MTVLHVMRESLLLWMSSPITVHVERRGRWPEKMLHKSDPCSGKLYIWSLYTDHVDYFKNHLDVFLSSIPGQPTVTGLGRAAKSSSLLHQLPFCYTQTIETKT